jgi:AcrR family transcriptional regulator
LPRHVDQARRRKDIAEASKRLLRRVGPAGLTLRSIAEELGGSITLITHYYPTRADLLRGVVDEWLLEYEVELEQLGRGAEPRARLQLLLEWMLPLDDETWLDERGRVLLIAEKEEDDSVAYFFDVIDERMRRMIAERVAPLVPADRLAVTVDVLRTLTNGIVLSAVEHRDAWPAQRQRAVLHTVLNRFDLLDDRSRTGDEGTESVAPELTFHGPR